jgi:hypothetical protein
MGKATEVQTFLSGVEGEQRRAEAVELCDLMQEVAGAPPVMWAKGIVGFGSRLIAYADGSEREWMAIGFSPRKQHLVLYVLDGVPQAEELLERLGPHKTGKECLYIRRLDAVDRGVLREILRASIAARAGS